MRKILNTVVTALLALVLLPGGISQAKTFFLDNSLASDCTSGNYSIANRSCSGSDGNAYNTLAEAEAALASTDTLYLRSGRYTRPPRPRGSAPNACFSGALNFIAAGTAQQHTTVAGYPGDPMPEICIEGFCNYNPDPTVGGQCDCRTDQNPPQSFNGGGCYYPHAAVLLAASHITLRGIKTYGQVAAPLFDERDVIIEDNDIGGGGPHIFQGNALIFNCFGGPCTDIIVRNNKIHHSTHNRDGGDNGATLITYAVGNLTVENNEFSDGWGSDIRLKDLNAPGSTVIIQNNLFRRSTIKPQNAGVEYCNNSSSCQSRNVFIRNNIFLNKDSGMFWKAGADTQIANGGIGIAYNNTFINSTRGDVWNWLPVAGHGWNNLHFNGGDYYDIEPGWDVNATYNYNCFSGSGRWRMGGNTYSTLSSHQGANGVDLQSVMISPNFVNPNGTNADDFKRTSYAENFSGSPYGNRCGAFVTGNEKIGIDWSGGGGNPNPPTLTLTKTVVNDNGGTASAGDFQAYISGSPVPWNVPQTLSAGSYTASEDALAGYTAGSWGGDCASNGTVSLSDGQNKTCTITNDDNGGPPPGPVPNLRIVQ